MSLTLVRTFTPYIKPTHFLFRQSESVPEALDSTIITDCIFPTREGQSITSFCKEADWTLLEKTYSDLIAGYKFWMTNNHYMTAQFENNFDTFIKKIFGPSSINNDAFRAAVFGNVLIHLLIIKQLLEDPEIPLAIRQSSCDDVAYRIANCSAGLQGEIQICRNTLESAKSGCFGLIQKDRIDFAKQLALQTIKEKSYAKATEVHLISHLLNQVAQIYGLPLITDDDRLSAHLQSPIITTEIIEQFKQKMALQMSPCGVFKMLTSRCLDAYEQALISTNTYVGQCVPIAQLPTGEINEQITICTASIKEFVRGLNFQLSWLFETIEDKDTTLYRVSLNKLKFELMKHICRYLISTQDGQPEHIEYFVLSRSFTAQILPDIQLLLKNQIYFYVLENNTPRPLVLHDLLKYKMDGFSDTQLFDLISEAVSNTIEIKALNAFYFEILESHRSKMVIDALIEVITNRLQNPEVIAHTVEWINEQHLDDDLLKTTPVLTLTPSSVPLPVHVALKRRSYLESPSELIKSHLLAPKHVQYLQPSWLQASFSLKDLTSSLEQAVTTDNGEAFTVLLRITELAHVTFSHRTQIHQNITQLRCNIIQYSTIKNANNCLKMALKANPEQINVPCENCTELTPLHLAVIFDNPMTVRILLNAKAELNAQALYGYTPMHWAIYYKRKDITAQLLECKPKPNLTLLNDEGHNCYSMAESEADIQAIIYNKTIIASDRSMTEGLSHCDIDTEQESEDTDYVLVSFDT